MMMLNKALLIVIAMVLFSGCGDSGSDHPATYPVTGKVTLGGSPVSDATVTFVPSEGGSPAVGTTNASGQYGLRSFGSTEGATPGNYLVQIVKYQYEGSGSSADEASADYQNPASAGGGSQNVLPPRYESAAASGLTASVTEKAGQNVFNFELDAAD
jgi:hypothetical protein